MTSAILRVVSLLFLAGLVFCVDFDINLNTKNGISFSKLSCNMQTNIDFRLSSSTTLKSCQTGTCTIENPSSSSLEFLDITGTLSLLPLTKVLTTTNFNYRGTKNSALDFIFELNSQTVHVVVPFQLGGTVTDNVIDMAIFPDTTFTPLLTSISGGLTSATVKAFDFGFLNYKDFGLFYHTASSNKQVTLLVNNFIFKHPNSLGTLPDNDIFKAGVSTAVSTVFDNVNTGDRLCWGSSIYGLFQTHIRQSYPMWVGWFSMVFFWAFVLLSNETLTSTVDPEFANRKWTCWSFYSLHYLADERYFTRLSRVTILLTSFTIQQVFLAAIFSKVGGTSANIIILWAAVVAMVATWPITYFLGYYLTTIYRSHLERMAIQAEVIANKEKTNEAQILVRQDAKDQELYFKYFAFYVIQICIIVCAWTVAVHLMQRTAWNQYYLHSYWLASLLVAFGLEHLVFTPLFTLVLGETTFWRNNGFFYDCRLGQTQQKLDE